MAGRLKRPLIVGLTGGVASGKSTVAAMLTQLGLPVLDTDRIAHELLADVGSDAYRKVVAEFGPGVLAPDGTIDRAALAACVFADVSRRKVLEGILHPLIKQSVERWVHELSKRHSILVLEVPLLLEVGWEGLVDEVVLVDCPVETQLERYVARTGSSRQEGLARVRSQLSREERIAKANIVLDNSGTLEELSRMVEALVKQLKRDKGDKGWKRKGR